MRDATKWLCGLLVAVMALTGPLSPAALAQTPDGAPDVEVTSGDRVGAGVMNVVYVPGKAIVCSLGTVASAAILLVTFGSAYRAAADTFKEGCGGTWMLTPEHVAGKIPPQEDIE
jgi:hypothetical protein